MNAPTKNEKRTRVNAPDCEIRFALRDEARQQKIAPRILTLIEDNVAIWTEQLNHLEKQERFLISEFLKSRPCVWCDSHVSWFEAIPPSAVETFSFAESGPSAHECPHCQKRIVYSLPFMGSWFWRKHDDDKNPHRVTRASKEEPQQ